MSIKSDLDNKGTNITCRKHFPIKLNEDAQYKTLGGLIVERVGIFLNRSLNKMGESENSEPLL